MKLAFILLLGAMASNAAVFVLNDQRDKDVCLSAHNLYRRFHPNTESLEWDDGLARDAEAYAKYLAKRRMMKHAEDIGNIGENLWIQNGGDAGSCGQAAVSWYGEEPLYNYAANRYQRKAGHFTQMVWQGTLKLGVGIAVNDSGGKKTTLIVARYKPAGNVRGYFTKNVQRQKPGVKLPTKFELDPSLCKDSYPVSACESWKNRCGQKLYKDVCPKTCGEC